jgi:hypothetical protein
MTQRLEGIQDVQRNAGEGLFAADVAVMKAKKSHLFP